MSIRNSLTNKNNSRPLSAKRALPPRKSTSNTRSRQKLSRANSNENANPYAQIRPSTASKVRPLGNYNHRRTASTATEEPKQRHKRQYSHNNLPERAISVGHFTETGYMPGSNKVNQDAYFEHHSIRGTDMKFFGVCDGHGHFGHDVSGYVKSRLPALLTEDQNLFINNKHAIGSAVCKLSYDLMQSGIDANFSGTTLISVLMDNKKLWCANCGDSRALLARQLSVKESNRHWMSIALSRDHKPDERDEATRILTAGGRIESYYDENENPLGPQRVWLQSENIPGLAMSRSVGDWVAESVGVMSDPEILEYSINPDDKFIVLGSDGIFDFIKNEEVVKMVVPYWIRGDVNGAWAALGKEARKRWMKEEEVIDDITCIVIFL